MSLWDGNIISFFLGYSTYFSIGMTDRKLGGPWDGAKRKGGGGDCQAMLPEKLDIPLEAH